MESRDHHCHNVSIHFVQLPNTFLWTSWLYGYASFLYRQNNSSLGGIFWTKKQNMLFTYSEYDPSYYFSSKTSPLRSTILIYISNVVIDHFQHTGNEFTCHCFVDEFLLRYLSISVDVNNLQNLFCSLAQNVVRHLYLGVSVRNMRYEQNRTRLAERTFVGRTAFFNCYFNTSNCHWWLNRRWQQQQRWCWRPWWWW